HYAARISHVPPFPTRRSSDLFSGLTGRAVASSRITHRFFGRGKISGPMTVFPCRRRIAKCRRLTKWPAPRKREKSSQIRARFPRSEEHTSELQSRVELVCRLL